MLGALPPECGPAEVWGRVAQHQTGHGPGLKESGCVAVRKFKCSDMPFKHSDGFPFLFEMDRLVFVSESVSVCVSQSVCASEVVAYITLQTGTKRRTSGIQSFCTRFCVIRTRASCRQGLKAAVCLWYLELSVPSTLLVDQVVHTPWTRNPTLDSLAHNRQTDGARDRQTERSWIFNVPSVA